MRGLLDSDLLAYEFGGLKNEEGEIIPLNFAIKSMHDRITTIKERSGADTLELYITGTGNFREKVATILPYKGNRPSEKPKHWKALRHELKVNCRAIVVDLMEADDAVSIEQYRDLSRFKLALYYDSSIQNWANTIICSRDKDLNMVPGWHYSWEAGKCKEKASWFQDELGGLRCFYKQLLTGDSVDNIPGLFRVGPKSPLVSRIDELESESSMYEHCLKQYQDRFGSYADQFIVENARLLWMLREEGEVWCPPELTNK